MIVFESTGGGTLGGDGARAEDPAQNLIRVHRRCWEFTSNGQGVRQVKSHRDAASSTFHERATPRFLLIRRVYSLVVAANTDRIIDRRRPSRQGSRGSCEHARRRRHNSTRARTTTKYSPPATSHINEDRGGKAEPERAGAQRTSGGGISADASADCARRYRSRCKRAVPAGDAEAEGSKGGADHKEHSKVVKLRG